MKNIYWDKLETLYSKIQGSEDNCLPLCAAENVVSPFCKIPLDSFVQEKYIMGGVLEYDNKNNFIGSSDLFKIYELINEQCKTLFGSVYADARTLSGINAVMSLLMSLFKAGDTILISGEDCGGHGSMTKICHRLGLKTIPMPYSYSDYDFDYPAINHLLSTEKIEGILICLSDIIFMPQLNKIDLPKDTSLIFDATQILGFIATDTIENPFSWFNDDQNFILMGATHKTLPGPTCGLIMTKNRELAARFDTLINPDYLRNTQLHQKLCLVLTLIELEEYGQKYMTHIVKNANRLAKKLSDLGFDIAHKAGVYTATHQVFVNMSRIDTELFYKKAAYYNLTLNARYKQLYHGSGIRLGLQAVTRYGWGDTEIDIVAEILHSIFKERENHRINREIEQKISTLSSIKDVHYTFNKNDFDNMQGIFDSLHNS
jgi:glycine hydroxymethyltransferase